MITTEASQHNKKDEEVTAPLASPPMNATSTVVLLVAAGLFGMIARKVGRGESERLDQEVHEAVKAHQSAALNVLAKPITLSSIPILVVGATAALVWSLHRQGRIEAGIAIAFAPVAAAAVGQSFTMFFEQRNPPDTPAPPGTEATEASFPSGHTTGVTAEALSIAYVLQREGLASPPVLAALLGWPLLVGVTRIYRDRHWISDVLAGWIAGTAVAAVSALVYGALVGRAPSSQGDHPSSRAPLERQREHGMIPLEPQPGE